MKIKTINPANEEILNEYAFNTDHEVETALVTSSEVYNQWRRLPLEMRLKCVSDFAAALSAVKISLAETMTREMGKTLKESLSEVDKCIVTCKTIAEEFPKWRMELIHKAASGYTVTREPLGVLLGIMPWNFPLWQVVRFAIPALLNGNSILLKHAPNTWGSAEMIESIFTQVMPRGLYINLKIDIPQVNKLIGDFRVRGVSLTGSVRAGASVGEQAGMHLKKCVLELGGNDAYVVLDDADVNLAAEICAQSRLINAGQSCVSAKRFIVTNKNVGAFTDKMQSIMGSKKWGDPEKSATDFGPLARKDLRDQLHDQVERSVGAGAKLTLGGIIPEQKGYFYPASVLTGVRPGQAAFDEEMFGPVASIIEARSEAEAFKLANQSRYGLGGAIFSRNVDRARALATTEMDSGMVSINDLIRSDALAPFGGVKDSGLGRELGKEGCFEFTNIKTVYIKPS